MLIKNGNVAISVFFIKNKCDSALYKGILSFCSMFYIVYNNCKRGAIRC